MEVTRWLAQHGLELLQGLGIIGGLVFTAVSLRTDARVRRVANLLTITGHHRELWTRLLEKPSLARILSTHVDLQRHPITDEEELFVLLVVLHLSSAHQAIQQGMFKTPDGLRQDIRAFFARPIPRAVWEKNKSTQDRDFVEFLDGSAPVSLISELDL